MSRDVKPVRDLPAGTLVMLPRELGRLPGYTEGGGSTRVLVPGHKSLEAVEMPPVALVEVVATPMELANAYLRGEMVRINRRWKKRRPRPNPNTERAGAARGEAA